MPKFLKKTVEFVFEFSHGFMNGFLNRPSHDYLFNSPMGRMIPTVTEILYSARDFAIKYQNTEIEISHLLMGMAHTTRTDAYHTLNDLGISKSKLVPLIRELKNTNTEVSQLPTIAVSKEIDEILNATTDIAQKYNQPAIGTAILLIAIVQNQSEILNSILQHFDVQAKDIIKQAEYYLSEGSTTEHQAIAQHEKTLSRAVSIKENKQNIKSRLQSWGLIEADEQENG